MKKNDLAGKWHEIKGSVKEYFAELTDDDFLEIEADHDKLLGKLQQRYDLNEETAETVIANMGVTDDGKIVDSMMQGEGNIEAARRFNAEQHKFAAQQQSSDKQNQN